MSNRFLVVGCGSIGQRHIANLLHLDAGTIVALDPREDRRQAVVSRFGVRAVAALDEAWRHEPDVALIAAPTSLHMPMALEAAAHECHLFIEKPLADRLDDIPRLLQLVRQHDLVALAACNLRFHPGLAQVKRLLEDEAIGDIAAMRVEFGHYLPDWHPGEDYRQGYSARRELGGGVVLDAIHEIDYACWMLGDVSSIACFAGRLGTLDIETEDTAAILLRFRSGAIGEVHLDYLQRAYSRACHLAGLDGTIRWDYGTGEVRWYNAAAQHWRIYQLPEGWQANDMYLDEMKHFLECLSGAARPSHDLEGAARVLEIALAAKRSAEHGIIIELPEVPGAAS